MWGILSRVTSIPFAITTIEGERINEQVAVTPGSGIECSIRSGIGVHCPRDIRRP